MQPLAFAAYIRPTTRSCLKTRHSRATVPPHLYGGLPYATLRHPRNLSMRPHHCAPMTVPPPFTLTPWWAKWILIWHSGPQQQQCELGQPHLRNRCTHCLYTRPQASTPRSQPFLHKYKYAHTRICTLDTPPPSPVDQMQDQLHAQVTIPATTVPADHRLHTQLTIHATMATQHQQLHTKLATT